MGLRNVLLAASVLALPAAAIAQPVSGIYVGGGAGVNWLQSQDLKSASVNGIGSTSLKGSGAHYNGAIGPVVVGSVGYGFGNGLRTEFEANYRYTHQKLRGASGLSGGVDNTTYGAMVNVLYDVNGLKYVVPYFGAGVGVEAVSLGSARAYTTDGSASFNGSTTEAHFGAQAIAGVAVPTGVPGLAVTAEYRFMGVFGDQKVTGTYQADGVSVKGNLKAENQYNHAVLVGVRYNFGAAPAPTPVAAPMAPAPAAAPAPAPARTYLVFFDWDKSDLTPRAHQIIAEAAQNSSRVQLTQIEVSGHADRSGTPA
ncbi:MAG: outer membrane beta-barrel protein, partial [Nevskia sp.]|nr:outer membrane beta-barrel protein [Nevskia sp.]